MGSLERPVAGELGAQPGVLERERLDRYVKAVCRRRAPPQSRRRRGRRRQDQGGGRGGPSRAEYPGEARGAAEQIGHRTGRTTRCSQVTTALPCCRVNPPTSLLNRFYAWGPKSATASVARCPSVPAPLRPVALAPISASGQRLFGDGFIRQPPSKAVATAGSWRALQPSRGDPPPAARELVRRHPAIEHNRAPTGHPAPAVAGVVAASLLPLDNPRTHASLVFSAADRLAQ